MYLISNITQNTLIKFSCDLVWQKLKNHLSWVLLYNSKGKRKNKKKKRFTIAIGRTPNVLNLPHLPFHLEPKQYQLVWGHNNTFLYVQGFLISLSIFHCQSSLPWISGREITSNSSLDSENDCSISGHCLTNTLKCTHIFWFKF